MLCQTLSFYCCLLILWFVLKPLAANLRKSLSSLLIVKLVHKCWLMNSESSVFNCSNNMFKRLRFSLYSLEHWAEGKRESNLLNGHFTDEIFTGMAVYVDPVTVLWVKQEGTVLDIAPVRFVVGPVGALDALEVGGIYPFVLRD